MDEINALPSKVKRYIHDLEMRINQNGQALTVMQLREERDLLHQRVEELEARIALQDREIFRSPDRNGLNRLFSLLALHATCDPAQPPQWKTITSAGNNICVERRLGAPQSDPSVLDVLCIVGIEEQRKTRLRIGFDCV